MVQVVDKVLDSVGQVFDMPLKVVSKGVVEPLLDVDVKVCIFASLALYFAAYVFLLWERAPVSCLNVNGVCSQIFLGNFDIDMSLVDGTAASGALKLLEVGIAIIVFLAFMKLVAVGVARHGIKPSAFVAFASVVGLVEALQIILLDLFQIGEYQEVSSENSRSGVSFKATVQAYLYSVIQLLRLNFVSGSYFFLILAVAFGTVGGLVARA